MHCTLVELKAAARLLDSSPPVRRVFRTRESASPGTASQRLDPMLLPWWRKKKQNNNREAGGERVKEKGLIYVWFAPPLLTLSLIIHGPRKAGSKCAGLIDSNSEVTGIPAVALRDSFVLPPLPLNKTPLHFTLPSPKPHPLVLMLMILHIFSPLSHPHPPEFPSLLSLCPAPSFVSLLQKMSFGVSWWTSGGHEARGIAAAVRPPRDCRAVDQSWWVTPSLPLPCPPPPPYSPHSPHPSTPSFPELILLPGHFPDP